MGQESKLPLWLCEASSYEPASDRDGFLRKNVLALASALRVFRVEAASLEGRGALDRTLARVPASVRLVSMIALITCASLARNMAFVWILAVAGLAVLAMRPARQIRSVLVPALLAALLAFVVNLPAMLLGQTSAPVRMGTKVLLTVGLVANLAQALGPEGMVAALRGCGLPQQVCMTVDMALRDIVLLGESAHALSEALALRSVGKDRTKTSSAAGVMGVTFVRAHQVAVARAEAMELRGYGASARVHRSRIAISPVAIAYACATILFVVLFVYLEVSLP